MLSLSRLHDLSKAHAAVVLLALGICFMLFNSLPILETRPKISSDEALSISIARNLLQNGGLNIETAPGVPYPYPHLIQSTGYPVTIPLAGVFGVFGFSFTAARLYMLAWMLAAVCALFFFLRSIVSKEIAAGSALLLLSFASFYANGRTVVGEIPGFAFLLVGLYFWITRKNVWLAGLFWSLAVVTKPSVFVLIVPALGIPLLIEKNTVLEKIKNITKIGLAMVPAAALGIYLAIPQFFTPRAWTDIGGFFANPYGESVSHTMYTNLLNVPQSTTLIYFGALYALILFATRHVETKLRLLYIFVSVYSLLAFMYYLRSPGWLRYILIAEFLILMLVPHALTTLADRWSSLFGRAQTGIRSYGALLAVVFLVALQLVQYQTAPDIYTSDNALRSAEYVHTRFPNASVSVIDLPQAFAVLLNENRSLSFAPIGVPPLGENPLLTNTPEDVFILNRDHLPAAAIQNLDRHYSFETAFNEYGVYRAK